MSDTNEPKEREKLSELYNPFMDTVQLSDGVEQSYKVQTYDPEIKSAQVQAYLMQRKHLLKQDAIDKANARVHELINLGWTKVREVVFFGVLVFSLVQCWNIAANSKSLDAQKAAIAAGSSLITGTVMYFLGKQASKH